MTSNSTGLRQRIAYLARGAGLVPMLREVVRRILSPVYHRDRAYLAIRYLTGDANHTADANDGPSVESSVVHTEKEIEEVTAEFPAGVSKRRLVEHVSNGPDNVVILALEGGHGQRRVIGYRLLVPRQFSYWYGKLRGEMPSDCVLMMDVFVLPERRGKRIYIDMRQAMERFCRDRGITKIVGLVKTHNEPSIRAHFHESPGGFGAINGTVERLTMFGGLYERITPWNEIQPRIEAPPPPPDERFKK